MFSRCSLDVPRIFAGCFQDAPIGLVGLVEFDDHFNENMDFNDPKKFNDPQIFDGSKGISFGSMDFDNQKV